jgi:catechol 2,3-dioxygenase-like lactoylglutathione lyase family enzyme
VDTSADSVRVQVQGLGQIGVSVQDLPAMTAFYRDTLGLQLLFEVPGMSFFDLGGIRLMLSLPSPGAEGCHGSILYLRVGDIGAAHERLRALGVAFEGVPHVVHRTPAYELWLVGFHDPEGNVLELMEERKLG